jgi:hypothetical protein
MARCHASRLAAAAAHTRAQQRAAEAAAAAMRARAAAQERAAHYRSVCRAEAQCVLTRAIKHYLLPYAALDVQRCWRGYQSRCALALRLEALALNASKRTERDRYLRALKALRREKRRRVQPRVNRVRRRMFGRNEFDHSGWHPGDSSSSAGDVSNSEVLSQHVWRPPAVNATGLRVEQVKLPAHSDWDKQLLQQQQQQQQSAAPATAAAANSTLWVGIPVATAARRVPKKKLGPPPRPGTLSSVSAKWSATKSVVNSGSSSASSSSGGQQQGKFVTKYSWLPASLVFGSGSSSSNNTSGSTATISNNKGAAAVIGSSAKATAVSNSSGDKRGVHSAAAAATAKAIG